MVFIVRQKQYGRLFGWGEEVKFLKFKFCPSICWNVWRIRLFVRGSCPCSVNHTCEDPKQTCSCDVKENKWFADEGFYSNAQSLGITNMYFLQQKDLDEEAKGRITLGPLECVETSKSKNSVKVSHCRCLCSEKCCMQLAKKVKIVAPVSIEFKDLDFCNFFTYVSNYQNCAL